MLLGIDALKRRAGTLLVQGELAKFPDFPIKKLTEKAITIKSARGHSYRAVELALEQLASKRFPLELLTTHEFGLADVDRAIRAVGGEVEEDVVHVSLLPWRESSSAHSSAPTASSSTRSPPSASRPCTRRRAAPDCSPRRSIPSIPARTSRARR